MSTPEMPTPSDVPTPNDAPVSSGVPTPPANPYASSQSRGGRALPIATMAVGLLALLTTILGAWYGLVFVAVGIVIALIGVGLGVTALVQKQRPTALSIVGVASGSLSLLVAVLVGALILGAAPVIVANNDSANDSAKGPQPSRGIDAEWPSNMTTGGVIFLGGDPAGAEIVESVAPPKGSEPFNPAIAASGDNSSANRIQLYVDYMCPACGLFEKTNLNTIEAALAQGETSLELRPLTFLDSASNGSYYSSRASGALACVASEQPELAWKAHTALLDAKNQPAEGTSGPDNKQLIKTLNAANGGLNENTQRCISQETYVPFAQGLNTWLLNTPVPQAKDPELMVAGTPTVVVNGVRYEGSISDAAEFTSFLKQQGVTLK